MSENNPNPLNENFDETNLDNSQHLSGKKPEDETKNDEEDTGENTGTKNENSGFENKPEISSNNPVNRLRNRLSQRKKKKENKLKDVENIAGALSGNPVAIAKLAKDPKKVILGVILSIITNPIFWAAFLIIFLAVLVAGSSASITNDSKTGLCKNVPNPSSVDKTKADSQEYKIAVAEAQKKTGVNYMLIEAIDYKENKLGANNPGRDLTATLTDIGNKIQQANYVRDADGMVKNDALGKPIEDLPTITGKITENMAIAMALINYKCVFVTHKNESGNLNDPSIVSGCFNTTKPICLQNGLKDPWMTKSDPKDLGAFMFYLVINKAEACKSFSGGGSGVPSSGKPGECIKSGSGSIASVPEFFQFSDPWAKIDIGSSGDKMRGGGCGLTSITMILNWYSKNVTPKETIDWLNANPPIFYAGGWEGGMYPKVAQNWGMNAGFNTIGWSEAEERLRNCKPVIAGNDHGSWAYTWHLVVLTGIDSENNVHVNDPFPADMKTGQYTVPIDVMKETIGNIIDVY